MEKFWEFIFTGLVFLLTLGIPSFLSLYNFIGIFRKWKNKKLKYALWSLTIVLGVIYTYELMLLLNVMFDSKWSEQLYNSQMHQPIWSGGYVTLIVISLVGVVGAIILLSNNVNNIPPLTTVLCISSMYLTLLVQILWTIQCLPLAFDFVGALYLLVPFNIFIIAFTIIREKIQEWCQEELHEDRIYGKSTFIKQINHTLYKYSNRWPVLGLFFVIPLLGLLLLILILFGQEPDAFIKAWTETSDWTLSLKEGPQNLIMDEHYLCTVAAGGHRKIVKPLRMGERHGHRIIVNRQLLIANAFENVLEEKTPKFHRSIRNFYDKYGFPIADLIRTNKIACDVTYFIMKPLEWLFLIVLYLVDSKPENRIAEQYLPTSR